MSRDNHEFTFDTKILEYLIAIADEAGLSRASDKKFISQPALSRYLKNVESSLGISLFSREHNRLIPGTSGKLFINGARSLTNIESRLISELSAIRHGRDKSLYIYTEELLSDYVNGEILSLFTRKYPDISVKTVIEGSNNIRTALESGKADIGLLMSDSFFSPFINSQVLFNDELVFCREAAEQAEFNDYFFKAGRYRDREFLSCMENTYLHDAQTDVLSYYSINSPDIKGKVSLKLLEKLILSGMGNIVLPQIYAKRLLRLYDGFDSERLLHFKPGRYYQCVIASYKSLSEAEHISCFKKTALDFFSSFMH